MRAPVLVLLILAVTCATLARGVYAEEETAAIQPHTDEQLKEHEVFERFEAKWSSDDMDERIQILRWFILWRHKSVLKELETIWLKDKEMELRAVAAEGLGNQVPFKKDAVKALLKGLAAMKKMASREDPEGDDALDQALEAKALVAGIKALGTLGHKGDKRDFKEMKAFIDHHHDDVAAEMMFTFGRTKEYRALSVLLEWFNFYPDGYSYAGGATRVDTGAAGNKDAKAAKAKWKAKYGSRKRKARPGAWEALIQSLEMITGVKFEKAEELKEWMKANKVLLRKHGA